MTYFKRSVNMCIHAFPCFLTNCKITSLYFFSHMIYQNLPYIKPNYLIGKLMTMSPKKWGVGQGARKKGEGSRQKGMRVTKNYTLD